MRGRARWAAWPWALAFAWVVASAAEPDGALILRAVWEDADRLRVTVHAVVPLEQVVVTWKGPQRLTLEKPELVPGEERLALAGLAAGSVQTLHLRLTGTAVASASRVAVVRVDALFRGRAIRESLGIPVGTESGGRLVHGVLEFPAAVEP